MLPSLCVLCVNSKVMEEHRIVNEIKTVEVYEVKTMRKKHNPHAHTYEGATQRKSIGYAYFPQTDKPNTAIDCVFEFCVFIINWKSFHIRTIYSQSISLTEQYIFFGWITARKTFNISTNNNINKLFLWVWVGNFHLICICKFITIFSISLYLYTKK